MKTTARKILSLVIVVCMAFIGVFVTPVVKADAAAGYYEKVTSAPADWSGTYLIVYEAGNVAFNGGLETLDAVSNTIPVTIADGKITANATTDAATFTIGKSGDGYTISSASGHYIGKTAYSNGLDSKQDTHTLSLDAGSNAVITASGGCTLRFNSAKDQMRFRYYKSGQQAIQLYKHVEAPAAPELDSAIEESLNSVNAHMSLSYQYTESNQVVDSITDELTRATTGVTGTSYASWSGKTANSSAVYAGQSAGGNDSIQLRSNNSNSGIITTTSGGKAKKITVEWNSSTSSGRTLDVYGKNTAYSAATDLYNSSTQGKKLGSIVCGTSTELTITGDYEYIGLRSNSGAMYLDSISIEWGGESTVVKDSQFAIKCAVDSTINDYFKDNASVESYGIQVTAKGGNTAIYTSGSSFWTKEADKFSVVIKLGDIINDTTKLSTEFTVVAFVVVGGETYTSTAAKTYSIASMVAMYSELGYKDGVAPLYGYLQEKGLL